MLSLKHKRMLEELTRELPELTPTSIERTISRRLLLGVIEKINPCERTLRCAIIGCGSIGSHVFRQLSVLPLEEILLIDTDTVDDTNTYRQDYYPDDVGLRKIDVLSRRASLTHRVEILGQTINDAGQLVAIIRQYDINLVIQAADMPTTDAMARLISTACEECGICCIVNPGYMGSAMSLPEFFFPHCGYSYINSHHVVPGKRLIQFQKSKLSYRLCSELGSLIAEQVEDYGMGKIPKYYGEKGYFDANDFSWRTRRIISAEQLELTQRKYAH